MGPKTKAEALQSDKDSPLQQERGLQVGYLESWQKGSRVQFQMTYHIWREDPMALYSGAVA